MNPYRPLHAYRSEGAERPDPELRGLAVLLVLLGVLRLIPTLAGEQPLEIEPAIALVMLVVGLLGLVDVRRRIRRWRAWHALRR